MQSNPSRAAGTPQYFFYELEPAEVVDVILNESHPEFNDYTDIGKAKIRFLHSGYGQDQELLALARPINSNMKRYPVLHEIVIVGEYVGEYYYIDVLNIFSSVNHNAFLNLSVPKIVKENNSSRRASEYAQISATNSPNQRRNDSGDQLGDVFRSNDNIKPLKFYEGDFILEGRFGNSIRFGSENGNPIIKIRNGQNPELNNRKLNEIVDEDINFDLSSIYISSINQRINLNPVTGGESYHLQFAVNSPSEFVGNQIVFNTDRIILNSKQNEILAFSNKSINLVSKREMTVNSGDRIVLNSKSDSTIHAPNIYLGSKDATEHVVLGDVLVSLLNELINILLKHKHPSGTGPTGPPLPPEFNQLNVLMNKLKTCLSKQNYTL